REMISGLCNLSDYESISDTQTFSIGSLQRDKSIGRLQNKQSAGFGSRIYPMRKMASFERDDNLCIEKCLDYRIEAIGCDVNDLKAMLAKGVNNFVFVPYRAQYTSLSALQIDIGVTIPSRELCFNSISQYAIAFPLQTILRKILKHDQVVNTSAVCRRPILLKICLILLPVAKCRRGHLQTKGSAGLLS